MSIVSGTIGAVMGSEATTDAANTTANAQRDATAQQLALQEKMYNQYRSDFAPYQQAGYYGLGQLYGNDVTYQDQAYRKATSDEIAAAKKDYLANVMPSLTQATTVSGNYIPQIVPERWDENTGQLISPQTINWYDQSGRYVGQGTDLASVVSSATKAPEITPYDRNANWYIDPATGKLVSEAESYKTIKGSGKPFSFTTNPYTGETLKPPSYDETVTNQLGNYEQSAGYQAQNALAQQALSRKLAARGLDYGATGASAGAQLSQQLTATDYDKYRQDLQQRYQGLSTDFAQLMGVNQNEYNRLLDATKIGQGAAASAGQAGNTYAQQSSQSLQNMANATGQAAMAAGQAQAGMWSGLGAASANTAGTALRAYDYGSTQGWWGSGGSGYSSLAEYEAAGGAVGEGEAYMALL